MHARFWQDFSIKKQSGYDLSLRPKEYIEEQFKAGFSSLDIASYCYKKLDEPFPNGIAFRPRVLHQFTGLMKECPDCFLLVGYYTPTSQWTQDLRDKISEHLVAPKNPLIAPPALLHTLKIKILFAESKIAEAVSLINQSSLHLNLSGENFEGVDLSEIKLPGVALQGAIFTNAILRGANFEGAQLDDARFKNADIRDLNLTNARLHGADFSEAILNEKEAQTILTFIKRTPEYFELKGRSLRKLLLSTEMKEALPHMGDFTYLINLCSDRIYLRNDLIDKLPLTPTFLAAASKNSSYVSHSYRVDLRQNHKTEIKLGTNFHGVPYCLLHTSSNKFQKIRVVNSKYLVADFKDDKRIIFDMEIKEGNPTVELDFSEHEASKMLPEQLPELHHYPEVIDAVYLHPDEMACLQFEGKLQFLKKENGSFVVKKEIAFSKDNWHFSLACLHPDQFALASFKDSQIEIWGRTHDSTDAFNFKRLRTIKLQPLCDEKTDCFKIITHYEYRDYETRTSVVKINPERSYLSARLPMQLEGLRALNPLEALLIRGNQQYQMLQKVSLATGQVTHQLEISGGYIHAKSFYPLLDGRTFLAIADRFESTFMMMARFSALIFDAKNNAFFLINGFGIGDTLGVASLSNTGQIVGWNCYDRRDDVFVTMPLPHLVSYLTKRREALKETLAQNIPIRPLRELIATLADEDIKFKSEEDLSIFYGDPIATMSPYDEKLESKSNGAAVTLSESKASLFAKQPIKTVDKPASCSPCVIQ